MFGPVNILPQLDLLKLYVSLLFRDEYAPMKFLFQSTCIKQFLSRFFFFL